MTKFKKFKSEHCSLFSKHAHNKKEALLIVALLVRYILSYMEGVIFTNRVMCFTKHMEKDLEELKIIMKKVSIPHICPKCGLMSSWEVMSMQSIVDVTWMIAFTKTAMLDDLTGYSLPLVEDIEAAIDAGCPIYIEFFCRDCCFEDYGYLRRGEIELLYREPND